MKRFFTALMLCLVSIYFVGCKEKNAPTDSTQQTTPTNNDLNTAESNCLVTIKTDGTSVSYLKFQSLIITDKNGKQVGSGYYWGSYYVPYDGNLTLNWEFRGSTFKEFKSCTYTFNVASAHEIEVEIGIPSSSITITYLKIGGSEVQRWDYYDL